MRCCRTPTFSSASSANTFGSHHATAWVPTRGLWRPGRTHPPAGAIPCGPRSTTLSSPKLGAPGTGSDWRFCVVGRIKRRIEDLQPTVKRLVTTSRHDQEVARAGCGHIGKPHRFRLVSAAVPPGRPRGVRRAYSHTTARARAVATDRHAGLEYRGPQGRLGPRGPRQGIRALLP